MKILYFDTETTGLPKNKNYKAPASDLDTWSTARLVQLGYIFDLDGGRTESEYLIRPDGFEIPEFASKIHGITNSYALENGKPVTDVLGEFRELICSADLLVGHNLDYDFHVLGSEYVRAFGNNPLDGKKVYDTMLIGTNYCKLPGNRIGSYKYPKLTELYQFLFNQPLPQTHTALDDIRNTLTCYVEMKSRGL